MPAFLFAIVMIAQSFFGGLPIDGIQCNQMEGSVEHIHARLELYNRGKAVTIPQGVGIPDGAGCLYWLHTHTADGYIHIESPVKRPFTLGEFFDIWGPSLSWSQAASLTAPHGEKLSIWVDGKAWHGQDPRAIVLYDHQVIVIQNGPPFARPAPADWSNL
jgi:hypothetical protein